MSVEHRGQSPRIPSPVIRLTVIKENPDLDQCHLSSHPNDDVCVAGCRRLVVESKCRGIHSVEPRAITG